jgi:3-oxoacyl-[acyl-carrier-protein] synthase-3
LVNWKDRETCILFGDGAGAFVLQARPSPGVVLSGIMRSDGSGGDLLMVPAGGSRHPASADTVKHDLHTIQMDGRKVFRFATRALAGATREVVAGAGLELDDIELVVPHQANLRIIEGAARELKLPMDRFMVNIERYGNTSSASIPMAVCEAVEQGRVRPGDHVVLVGFGAGLTWGALAVQWVETKRPVRASRRALLSLWTLLARLRSALAWVWRRIEGFLWGGPSRS